MPVFVVANPKGGVGKSTLATNLAGYLAARGYAVMLGDADRQQSSRTWLDLRPVGLPEISTWEVSHDDVVRPPKGTTHVVLDTPAGLSGKRLDEVMKIADRVLVPLQPSIFDIHATHDFLQQLAANRRSSRVGIGVVGMRTREGTIATDQLRTFLGGLNVPLLTFLRDTQNYVHLAAHGLSLWDVASSRFERDVEQWQPIITWIN
ncbi:ParA family protein [Piscinibacter koreensis]|uniref:ParA family protein n=1 Tax=Piscinibacter koreensis TaxID=2742824 RepID=A0A7Y6NPC1_9BURK|nr:ParA family protein [Schlegelella koreensis]NUZ06871.1 ParA family protein [Schlegelella koreensis]